MQLRIAHTAIYHRAPGTTDHVQCMVCGTDCAVSRNVETAGNWGMAMAKRTRRYDVFACPHLKEEWHERAAYLYKAAQDERSPRLAALIRLELEDVLRAHRK
jgi:hypothetical protein